MHRRAPRERFPWWNRLWQDPDAYQRWKDRWYQLRQNQLSTTNIWSVIDTMASEIGVDAARRNFEKWTLINWTQWQGEVNILKTWLSNRSNWIDGQFLEPPTFSREGGTIQPGEELSITAPVGTIYYTLDGSDPRAHGGAVALGARSYQVVIPIIVEARFAIMAAIIAGFGRIIGEVGSAMMLGGNIRGFTRSITTAIALETSKGEFSLGLALGIILITVALSINMLLRTLQQHN